MSNRGGAKAVKIRKQEVRVKRVIQLDWTPDVVVEQPKALVHLWAKTDRWTVCGADGGKEWTSKRGKVTCRSCLSAWVPRANSSRSRRSVKNSPGFPSSKGHSPSGSRKTFGRGLMVPAVSSR